MRKKTNQFELEDELFWQIRAAGLTEPFRQYKLVPGRKLAWDFAWVFHKLVVEVNGGTYVPQTGHTSGKGIARDYEKANLAALAGWKQLTFTAKDVHDGIALEMIERVLNEQAK